MVSKKDTQEFVEVDRQTYERVAQETQQQFDQVVSIAEGHGAEPGLVRQAHERKKCQHLRELSRGPDCKPGDYRYVSLFVFI